MSQSRKTLIHVITIILLLVTLISIWAGFYQLVKQQGRILLRLDALEEARKAAGAVTQDAAKPEGLPLKTPFPAFTFPDLSGKNVALEDFLGTRILLIQWDFVCGFCESILPDLERLQASFAQNKVRIVLLARGDEESNRQHATRYGLQFPLLLTEGRQSPEPFQGQGTPVGYLLDERGRVAAPFASGADEVLALAMRIAMQEEQLSAGENRRRKLATERPLSESHLERNGLKQGTRAPTFHLPDVQSGRTVSLQDYRGRRVLLVFTDPHCGPCDELAPYLTKLDEEHRANGLSILLVGRGDVEENRSKAEQYKFQFPVVVQEKWKLSREYGIFATPVAFLIGQDGVIAKNVAVGKDAVLALARAGLGEPEE